jgi:hypothetical protein
MNYRPTITSIIWSPGQNGRISPPASLTYCVSTPAYSPDYMGPTERELLQESELTMAYNSDSGDDSDPIPHPDITVAQPLPAPVDFTIAKRPPPTVEVTSDVRLMVPQPQRISQARQQRYQRPTTGYQPPLYRGHINQPPERAQRIAPAHERAQRIAPSSQQQPASSHTTAASYGTSPRYHPRTGEVDSANDSTTNGRVQLVPIYVEVPRYETIYIEVPKYTVVEVQTVKPWMLDYIRMEVQRKLTDLKLQQVTAATQTDRAPPRQRGKRARKPSTHLKVGPSMSTQLKL